MVLNLRDDGKELGRIVRQALSGSQRYGLLDEVVSIVKTALSDKPGHRERFGARQTEEFQYLYHSRPWWKRAPLRVFFYRVPPNLGKPEGLAVVSEKNSRDPRWFT